MLNTIDQNNKSRRSFGEHIREAVPIIIAGEAVAINNKSGMTEANNNRMLVTILSIE